MVSVLEKKYYAYFDIGGTNTKFAYKELESDNIYTFYHKSSDLFRESKLEENIISIFKSYDIMTDQIHLLIICLCGIVNHKYSTLVQSLTINEISLSNYENYDLRSSFGKVLKHHKIFAFNDTLGLVFHSILESQKIQSYNKEEFSIVLELGTGVGTSAFIYDQSKDIYLIYPLEWGKYISIEKINEDFYDNMEQQLENFLIIFEKNFRKQPKNLYVSGGKLIEKRQCDLSNFNFKFKRLNIDFYSIGLDYNDQIKLKFKGILNYVNQKDRYIIDESFVYID